jgi:hypothetical protein
VNRVLTTVAICLVTAAACKEKAAEPTVSKPVAAESAKPKAAQSAAPSAAPSPEPKAAAGKPLTAIDVCAKLEAAGAAAKCKESETKDGATYAIFKANVPNAGGVISVFDDVKTFEGIVKKLEPTAKGKHAAHSPKVRAHVSWDSNDAALDTKIRAVVDAL